MKQHAPSVVIQGHWVVVKATKWYVCCPWPKEYAYQINMKPTQCMYQRQENRRDSSETTCPLSFTLGVIRLEQKSHRQTDSGIALLSLSNTRHMKMQSRKKKLKANLWSENILRVWSILTHKAQTEQVLVRVVCCILSPVPGANLWSHHSWYHCSSRRSVAYLLIWHTYPGLHSHHVCKGLLYENFQGTGLSPVQCQTYHC